ncbi:MAG TPA: peptide ABC transporter substrate-binding protein [Candidatus Binatia bacterium]|nr:peptide ABC transporter substrate-binding protein [Candidatus Binatia bacterium]
MDEHVLRDQLEQVKRGQLSRRRFVQGLAAAGLTAPLAAQLLASAGVAGAEPRQPLVTPPRRGGGGALKILMWDAPTMLHPHFGRGLRDFTASRIFYEPLAAVSPDGALVPVLADEVPSLMNGGVSRDGQWVTWRLKRNVSWHDGKPFTADDVVFNWEFAADPGTGATSRGPFEQVARIDKLDAHTVKVVFKKPQPFWAVVFTGGGLVPKHIFEPFKGAGAREAVGSLKPVGTGPYTLAEFKPGDMIRADINPHYHLHNRPYFDRLDIKGGGDAVSAARAVLQTGEYDFGYYILAEEDVLARIEQGGKGRILEIPTSGMSHVQCNMSDPWREVDGERSNPNVPHPCLSDPAVRTALTLLIDRASIQSNLIGRNGKLTPNFLNVPDRVRSRNTTWEFSVERANRLLDEAGWARGADGIRARDTRRLKFLFQAAANATVQKIQLVVKQAAARAGIDIEVKAVPAAVFFSGDASNADTTVRFLADLQMYTVFTGLDPQFYMAQFVSWEIPTRDNRWSGRNLTRWRHADYDRLWREAETEMDPVRRAELFIRMNDMVVQGGVVMPVTWRNELHAVSNQILGVDMNGWDSIFGRIAYWGRQG